jgi:iron complex transport system substrate-binding protein
LKKGNLKMNRKIIPLLTVLSLLFCSCDNSTYTEYGGDITTMPPEQIAQAESRAVSEAEKKAESISVSLSRKEALHKPKMTINNREGGYSMVPEEVNTIISGSPALTEILMGLGLGEKIIQADPESAGVYGLDPAICTFNAAGYKDDGTADLILIAGKTSEFHLNGNNVFYIPPSESIEGIKLDIEYISVLTGTQNKAPELIADINTAMMNVREAAYGIPPKAVYYEISMGLTPGYDTLINEVISIAGGSNIFGTSRGTVEVTPEEIAALDPDVILQDRDDPDLGVSARPGWGELEAVLNNESYILTNRILPSQKITAALYEISGILTGE